MTHALYRATCPPSQELGDHQLGLLASQEAAAVAEHVTVCPHCTSELAQLSEFMDDLAPELEFSPMERIRVLIASLVESGSGAISGHGGPAPAFAGIRGADDGQTRIYQADDIQIAIETQPDPEHPERGVLLGLVTGTDMGELQVRLLRDEDTVATAPVDEIGNFEFDDLSLGEYQLTLSSPGIEIHVSSITV